MEFLAKMGNLKNRTIVDIFGQKRSKFRLGLWFFWDCYLINANKPGFGNSILNLISSYYCKFMNHPISTIANLNFISYFNFSKRTALVKTGEPSAQLVAEPRDSN